MSNDKTTAIFCPKCQDTGRLTTQIKPPSGRTVFALAVIGCDCPAGREWNARHTAGLTWPAWGTPNHGGWNNPTDPTAVTSVTLVSHSPRTGR